MTRCATSIQVVERRVLGLGFHDRRNRKTIQHGISAVEWFHFIVGGQLYQFHYVQILMVTFHSLQNFSTRLRNASAFARRSSALMLSTRSISFSKRIASSPYKMGVSFQGNLYLIVICMIWFTWTKVAIPFCNSNILLSKTALVVSGFRIDFNIFYVRRLPVGWEAVSQPGGRAAPSRLGDGLAAGWELPSHPAGR